MPVFRLLLFAILCLPPPISAESITMLTDENATVEPGWDAGIFEDTTGSMDIREAASPALSARYRTEREAVPNLGFTRSAIWVRLKLENLTFTESWILQAAYPDMDNVEYYAEADSNWVVRELGQRLPFASRNIFDRKLLFELDLPFGTERTYYLRYQNATGMTIPLRLLASRQYHADALGEQLAFGICFGFMLVLSLYNLILYAKIREPGYAYYFMYITGYGLFLFSLYGLAHQFLWPGLTGWAGHNAVFFLALAFFCRTLFSMSVLDSRGNAPRLHAALKGSLVALILLAAHRALALSGWLPAAWAWESASEVAGPALYFAAFTLLILLLNFLCLRKGVPAAKAFMGAWIFMVSGLLLYALKTLGILPSNPLTEYSMLAGSLGEMCLLFLGLGESIRAIKSEARERRRRQQEALRAFQEEQIRSMRLELELLKANIQPHFMLNSLNAAIMWLREDPPSAERLLYALSGELRQLLKIVGEKVIPIGEEIRMCRMHLEVMSLRNDKRFTLELEGIEERERIPPMVFHTLVENGLTHGYARKDAGTFTLSRREDESNVRFTLHNDGDPGATDGGHGGLGLKYVRARLEESYGPNWRMESRSVPGGWAVTIAIPKLPVSSGETVCAS